MQAIVIRQFGGPDVLRLEDVPRPRPLAGEVLVRVHAAGVSALDTETRAGRGAAGRLHGFPVTLGWTLSGVIEAVGEGTARRKVGDHVYGLAGFPEPAGTHAEFAVAPESSVAFKPRNLTHPEAAALPLAALTAHQALQRMDLRAGQSLLVCTAGTTGDLAVQLAQLRGARVLALTAHPDRTRLRGLGAEVLEDVLGPSDRRVGSVDAVLDTEGSEVQASSFALLKPGGWLVSTTPASPAFEHSQRPDVHAEYLQVRPSSGHLEYLTDLIESGRLRPPFCRMFPMEEATRAHEYSEGSNLEEVVLEVRARPP